MGLGNSDSDNHLKYKVNRPLTLGSNCKFLTNNNTVLKFMGQE